MIGFCRVISKGEDLHLSVVSKPLPIDDQLYSVDVSTHEVYSMSY